MNASERDSAAWTSETADTASSSLHGDPGPVSGAAGTTLRGCVWPNCAETIDIAAVHAGEAKADGWLLLRSIGAAYLCHVHAARGHVPTLKHGDGESAMGCSCRWITRAVAGDTLAALSNRWRQHVRALADELDPKGQPDDLA